MKKSIFILFFLFFIASCFAQSNLRVTIVPKNAPFEWGKISQADLDMKVYPLDSSADAVVLDRYGDMNLYAAEAVPAITYKVHERKKILKKSVKNLKKILKKLRSFFAQ